MKMSDEQKQYREIRKIQFILMIIMTIVSILLFRDIKVYAAGVIIGSMCAFMGFNSIIKMTDKLHGEMDNIRGRAFTSYLRRYIMYTIVFGLSVYEGVHPLALLAGYMCNKLAIQLYAFRHKEGG